MAFRRVQVRFGGNIESWCSWADATHASNCCTFGLNRKKWFNPEANLDASTQYIKSLNLIFREIKDKDERIKFILASYNSGPSHILDAMALAKKYGKNPHIWFNHVEMYLLKKNDPTLLDPVVKMVFRGRDRTLCSKRTDTYENT